jgi:hypothetical protein
MDKPSSKKNFQNKKENTESAEPPAKKQKVSKAIKKKY